MIRKYRFGKPIHTDAVVVDIRSEVGELPYFDADNNGIFVLQMSDSDIVYGLGEQIRGINKRGWQYINWNYDNPHHHEDTRSLYGSHNFIIVRGDVTFGAFFDMGGKIVFDIGYTDKNMMKITASENNLDVYIIDGDNETDIVRQFRKIIGKSYIPPVWAFGYGQSRWGYKDEEDIRSVATGYAKYDIPLDSIYMDIDYMTDYKDFTVNPKRFSDLAQLVRDMKDKGIHLVPIIDAGVKIEEGYDVYEEGVSNNYFCKDANGNDFVGAVWPGKVHFPDFMNEKTRKWFGEKYSALTQLGIDGFWNDMNEPAIFYTEDRLAETIDTIEKLKLENMGINEYFQFTGMVAGLNGNYGDYEKFYHNIDGEMINHNRIHNLYGMNMTRSAYEALQMLEPDKKTLFFSRSSYIGAHRYGGIWQGDNKSWWSHILQSMQQLPALNMAGFMFVGADVGGFGCDVTEDLMIRWLQYAMFTPLYRNHSADGTRRQELYQFGTVNVMGEMVKIRMCLIPYLYETFIRAVEEDEMMFKPLSFEYGEDVETLTVEDQLLVGRELMIAPIYRQNARGRYVYLPEEMMLFRMRKYDDYDIEILPQGHHYVRAELNEVIFFIRKNKSIKFCNPSKNTEELDFDTNKRIGYI